jgi:hypothetical protein
VTPSVPPPKLAPKRQRATLGATLELLAEAGYEALILHDEPADEEYLDRVTDEILTPLMARIES